MSENGASPTFDFDKYADQMQAEAETLRTERHELAAQLDELDDRLRRLDTAIRALNGQLPKPSKPTRSKGSSEQSKQAVLRALQENGPEVTQADVTRFAGVSKGTAARVLEVLEGEGVARHTNPDRRGSTPKLWELVH